VIIRGSAISARAKNINQGIVLAPLKVEADRLASSCPRAGFIKRVLAVGAVHGDHDS
jgi:hypothetical protein